MNSRNIYAVLALIIGVPIAVFLGVSIAQNQVETVLWVGAVGFLILCIALGRHVWILIPGSLGMAGVVNCIPGFPAPWQVMTAVVLGFTILRLAVRQQRIRFRWTGMETVIFLVYLTIFQAFVRNPTGLSLLGGELAGGRPYLVFGVALFAYLLIAMADADLRSWRWAMLAFLAFSLLDGMVSLGSALTPDLAGILIRYYSNVSFDAAYGLDYVADVKEVRISQFGQIGTMLGVVACSFWRPMAALDIRKPWRALIAGIAVIATIYSGFRSYALRLFVFYCLGSFVRRKPVDVFVVVMLGPLLLAAILVFVPATSLPFSAQRILSELPVDVSSAARSSAESSTEVRIKMWKMALTSDRYISNKALGDGFSMSAAEMKARISAKLGDTRMTGDMQYLDVALLSGSYHGFHVETIRFTGVVGLLAATLTLIVFAVVAWRCIQHYRGHPWWGVVLFACMPIVIAPWWNWLVFGSYRTGFPLLIVTAGMIKLLDAIRLREALPTLEEAASEAPEGDSIATSGQVVQA